MICNLTQYIIGEEAVITSNNTVSGVLTDNPYIAFETERPDGTITSYQYGLTADIIKVSTGIYKVLIPLNESGVWKYRWFSAVPNMGASQGQFIVNPSNI